MDWTIALLFRNDVVKLDLFGQEHPSRRRSPPPSPESTPAPSSPGPRAAGAASVSPPAAPEQVTVLSADAPPATSP
jgi:hypothetical protein